MQKNTFLLHSKIKPNLRSKMVAPEDVIGGRVKAVSFENAIRYNLTPYCIDFERSLLINALDIDPVKAAGETFQYDYIRNNAQNFIYIPIHSLPENTPNIELSPVLLFSPGRCGSTLLSKVIAKIGVISISEPDIYSQVAVYFAPKDKTIAQAKQVKFMLKWANYFLLSPFLKRGATNVLIKFRSHVNESPRLVLSSFPAPHKTIFLKRDFESWCISRMRVFSNSIENNLAIYIQSLFCLKFLLKSTDCLVLNYEDLKENPKAVIKQLSVFFGTEIQFEDLKDVLEKDSQANTRLARDKIKKELTAVEIESIKSIWRERAPYDLLKELKL